MSTEAQTEPASIRYGLIGTGTMGREHIRNVGLIDGSEIVAIADPHAPSREAAQQLLGGTAAEYEDHATMLAEADLDALIVATPNDTHADILIDVMSGGRRLPILVEKPLCTTPDDVERLRAAARDYDAPIWVAMEYRYMPPMQALLDETHGGGLGTPRMLAITEHRFPFLDKVDNWNRYAARTGGTLVEKACHFFDLMRLILRDEPVRVYASGAADVNHRDESYDGHVPDILDNAFVVVDFAGGSRALLNLCMFAEGTRFQEHVSVVGDTAKVECFVPVSGAHWEGARADAYVELSPRDPQGPVQRPVPVDPAILEAGGHHGSTYYEHLRFQQVVRGEAEVEVTLEDGLRAVLMGMAAERSAAEHVPVELDFSAR
ncbi:Gfo/Idh/MocA family protein [Microbacterium sp. No. 7]|uniref:Gfo/Idh/MocA family protein n=1 Tax=Microbacterium sp. No. 7 TaxID=1714373 RepID=UPI0006ECE449|nr:Gfo/Idh/MocA family oxidoreductase [Microbacterium sp. No. 7]ALJ21989.1 oxidoreductase [Microbacterium sp. No. 7]